MEAYFVLGGDKWRINLNFQDFEEPCRMEKLESKMEVDNIILQTPVNLRILSCITI
ncbi:MAG: hypothetical protein H6599_11145 [Flavobacteriales bacterium]|nr:hypothetical protein [Flavobacteriales bacterium]